VPRRGQKLKLLRLAEQNASLLLEEEALKGSGDGRRAADVVRALQRELGLASLPRRIACFDVSTIQGADPVGACVVFDDGEPRKGEYRRFRIQYVEGQDDFAMIAEIVGRYFRGRLEGEEDLPDLVVIDGGKGQLGSALAVLRELGLEDLPTLALAKQDEEIYLAGRSDALVLPRRSEALRLLQRVRNEAHRFAVAYHRKRRQARTLISEVETIPGVGPRRRKALLTRFGSLDRVRAATPEDVAQVPGLSLAMARRILEHLRRSAGPDGVAETGEPGEAPLAGGLSPGAPDGTVGVPEDLAEAAFDGMGRPL
jgi:excinuclease ABC subunit C